MESSTLEFTTFVSNEKVNIPSKIKMSSNSKIAPAPLFTYVSPSKPKAEAPKVESIKVENTNVEKVSSPLPPPKKVSAPKKPRIEESENEEEEEEDLDDSEEEEEESEEEDSEDDSIVVSDNEEEVVESSSDDDDPVKGIDKSLILTGKRVRTQTKPDPFLVEVMHRQLIDNLIEEMKTWKPKYEAKYGKFPAMSVFSSKSYEDMQAMRDKMKADLSIDESTHDGLSSDDEEEEDEVEDDDESYSEEEEEEESESSDDSDSEEESSEDEELKA